jgi:hypothetical protein
MKVTTAEVAKALAQDKKAWRRSKIMIVGEGTAGKSSLANNIIGRHFEETMESTIGINELTCDVKIAKIRENEGKWCEHIKSTDALFEAFLADIILNERSDKRPNKSSNNNSKTSLSTISANVPSELKLDELKPDNNNDHNNEVNNDHINEVKKDIEKIRAALQEYEINNDTKLKYAFLSDFNFKGERRNDNCYMHMVKPFLFTDGHIYACPSAELSLENNYNYVPESQFMVCDIDGIEEFYSKPPTTRKHACNFCKYAMQNELIDDILTKTEHNEFA